MIKPHFFKVNGNYLDHYPIKSTSLPDFILHQEISPALLVNEPITFQIEKNNIPLPDKKSSDNSFTIDFGDGQKFKGIQTEHTYLEVGSYILTISVKPNDHMKEFMSDGNKKIEKILKNYLMYLKIPTHLTRRSI